MASQFRRQVVVEVHSEAFHTMPSDIERDEERIDGLLAAGDSVVVYWEFDIWHDSPTVRSSLRWILDHPDDQPTVHRPTPDPYAYRPDGSLVRNRPSSVDP